MCWAERLDGQLCLGYASIIGHVTWSGGKNGHRDLRRYLSIRGHGMACGSSSEAAELSTLTMGKDKD